MPGTGISRQGQRNGGLKIGGSQTGKCRSRNFLETSNTFHRRACKIENGNEYCGNIYALYFEKDQTSFGFIPKVKGHRHDWEFAAVWTKNGRITHGSVSAHGDVETRPASALPFESGHLKVVYHQEDPLTHAMRFAKVAERAENPYQRWVTPTIASWFELEGEALSNREMRNRLNNFNYGAAVFPLRDDNFIDKINEGKPSEYPKFNRTNDDNPDIKEGCVDYIQHNIPWDIEGVNKTWLMSNLEIMCRGTRSRYSPGNCFSYVMRNGRDWGKRPTDQVVWQHAHLLCSGTSSARSTTTCFKRSISFGNALDVAIERCRGRY